MPGPLAHSSKVPCLGIVSSRTVSLVKGLMPTLTHGCFLPKGMGGQALADWPFQPPNIAGPVHMPGFSAAVLPCSPGRESLDTGSAGMPSG